MGGAQGQRPTTMGQAQSPRGEKVGLSEQQRQRIRASDQQRNQYRTSTQAANRVRTRAREMARAATGSGFNPEAFRQLRAQLQNEISLWQQEHEQFMATLTEEQQTATRERDREMDKEIEELNVWAEAMDEELKQESPDPKQLAKQAREIEKATKNWQEQNRQLGSDLSIK
jgi:dsDNA-specific endonuclease/ATPase MutS2